MSDILPNKEDGQKVSDYVYNILKDGFELLGLSEEGAKKYSKAQSKKYLKTNKADGFAIISFPSYRDILLLASKWSKEMEEDYKDIMKGKTPNPKGRDVSSFPILKTVGVGSVQDVIDKLNIKGTYKHALMPLNPLVVKDTILEDIHKHMLDQQVDFLQFESAVKTGALLETNEESGKPELQKFPKNKQEVKNLKFFQTISGKDFGIQVKTDDKETNMVTIGKQIRTMLLSNLYSSGNISPENQLLVDKYIEAQTELTNYLVEESFNKLGFEIDESGNLTENEDNREKLVEYLKEVATNLDSNTVFNIDSLLDENILIDFLQNPGKIQNKILSLFRKSTVNQKTSGVMGILASFEGLNYTSGGALNKDLLWYEVSKNTGEVLPTEIYLKIPDSFKFLLKEKYEGDLEALNKDVELSNQVFRDYHNKKKGVSLKDAPIPLDLLTIMGYRIPTQAYSSIEYIIIKKFLSPTSGDTVVASDKIVTKTDSDFDVDKLTMYLPKFNWYKDKGFVIPEGETTNGLDYYLERLNDLKRKSASKTKEKLDEYFETGLWFKELGWNTETLENLSEPELRTLYLNLNLTDTQKEDRLIAMEEELINRFEKDVLYNNLLNSQLALLKIPSQLSLLLNPVTTDTLKTVSDDIKEIQGITNNIPYYFIGLPSYNVALEEMFITGKKLIGAISNFLRSHVISQITGLYVSDPYSKIFFEHNTKEVIEYEKKGKKEVKKEKTVIDLGGTVSKDKNYVILSLFSEFVSAYVDIAKDPFIFFLNMKGPVLNSVLYLLKAGVNPRQVAFFVAQESVKDYLLEQSINESEPVVVTSNDEFNNVIEARIINKWKEKIGDKDLINNKIIVNKKKLKIKSLSSLYSDYINNTIKNDDEYKINLETLNAELKSISNKIKNNVLDFSEENLRALLTESKQEKTDSYNVHQEAILQLFLYYTQQGKVINGLSTAFKDDTTSLTSIDEIKELKKTQKDLIGSKFFYKPNILNYVNNPVLISFKNANNSILAAVSTYYLSESPVIKEELDLLKNEISTWNYSKSPGDFKKLSNVVNNTFIDFLIQNFYSKVFPNDDIPINNEGAEILMISEDNIPDQILDIKNNPNHKLFKNKLINNLIVDKSREKQNNLKVFNYVNSDTTSQELINAFEEIANYDYELAKNLIKLNLLQSGKLFSKISSLNLMGAKMYFDMVIPVLKYATDNVEDIDFSNFEVLLKDSHKELLPRPTYSSKTKKPLKEYYEDSAVARAGFFKISLPVKSEAGKALDKKVKNVQETIDRIIRNISIEKDRKVIAEKEKKLKKNQEILEDLEILQKNSFIKYWELKAIPVFYNETREVYEADWRSEQPSISDSGYRINMDETTISDYQETIEEEIEEDISDTAEFDKLPNKSSTPTMTYAGIGSRETPKKVLDKMTEVAEYLEKQGYILNTGVAFKGKEEGADGAFSKGTSKKNLFAPENAGKRELKVAEEIHPAWEALVAKGPGGPKLMARNTNQIFGAKLDTPVDFVLFWAEDKGKVGKTGQDRPEGGTGHAVEMARAKGIPTINMMDSDWRIQLSNVLKELKLNNKGTVSSKIQKPNLINQSTQPSTNVKKDVQDVFNSNPELGSIGTVEQYSAYLDTIFPDSKIKDILYHGTADNFASFIAKEKKAIFLKRDKKEAQSYAEISYADKYFPNEEGAFMNDKKVKGKGFVLPVIINTKNPEITNKGADHVPKDRVKYDGFDNEEEVGVFKLEQIHILGSKQDTEGFKEFVTKSVKPSSSVGIKAIQPKVNITNYRTMDEKSKKDAINGIKEAQKRWVEEEIAEFYEAIEQVNKGLDAFSSKGVNRGKATMDDVIDETLGIFRTVQMFPEFSDVILPYLEDIKIALNTFGRKEGYAIYKAKKDAKGQAKEMTYENLFETVDKFINQPTRAKTKNVTFDQLTELTSKRKQEILTSFAKKHKMTKKAALEYINNSIQTDGKKKILNLLNKTDEFGNNCY